MRKCEICSREQDDSKFIKGKSTSHDIKVCKDCLVQKINPNRTSSFLWILKELDMPFIFDEYLQCLKSFYEQRGVNPVLLYISKMKLKAFASFGYADSLELNKRMGA